MRFEDDDLNDELDWGIKNKKHVGSKKRKQQRKVFGIAALVSVVILAVLIGGFIIKRYTPTKDKMSGYDYFEVSKDSSNLVLLDGVSYADTGVYINGQLYLPQSFINENINIRYYYDKESNAVLYTDPSKTYTFIVGQTAYQDNKGGNYTSEYPVAVMQDTAIYLNWNFVGEHTNCTFEYGTEPARVSINTKHEEIITVTTTKSTAVRYRAGIKSEVLEEINEGTKLTYVNGIDDWSKVITPSGYTGYLKNSTISDQVTEIPEDTFTDNYNKISKDKKISLAWFQVASEYGNDYIDDYLAQTSGITTISPTWYTITDASGNMDCYATADFVSKMHAQGMEVWPLVNDFNTDVDFKALYSSKTARTKMINKLIGDAAAYGYDGINIDLENVRTAYSLDFLQFIRELSLACEEHNLVLSTDNYKPESYNQCYHLKEQAAFIDYAVLMAYDEHYNGSDAGSVASLSFVEEGIKDITELVPKEQVICAIPFYTRVWTTNGNTTTSEAVDMQTAINQLGIYGATAVWSEDAGQYVMSVPAAQGTVQIWFEEDKSIGEKMKKIQQYELAGVAEWRLGLEKSSVWSVITQYLN